MDSGNPLAKFCAAFLNGTPAIEFAAASYSLAGKVERVEPGRMPVGNLGDLERVAPWLRARNANGCAIWARPAADAETHPWVFLDDLPAAKAVTVAKKYAALAVETSTGNAQVWIRADRDLSRAQRQDVSRALAQLIGADPHAIAEPRWGRAPSFKSGKPRCDRFWTRLLADSSAQGVLFDPTLYLSSPSHPPPTGGRVFLHAKLSDRSGGPDESAKEFAYALHALRAGTASERVVERLAAHALKRGKRVTVEACRLYAQKTVENALRAL
jgi:head-tail adaptor